MKNRKTLGVLINDIDGNYQTFLWLKIKEAAEKYNCNLIVYEGRTINPVLEIEKQHQVIYEFVSRNRVDGIIITSATISSRISRPEFIAFCKKFANIPMISIGETLPEATSLMIDNKKGMKGLLQHLTADHGYRDIVFVTGPLSNPEARERYEAYLEILDEKGIRFNEDMVFNGNFESQSGYDIMDKILTSGIKYDAVVFSNDDMALGAVKCYNERSRWGKVDISQKCVICGFDDSINSSLINPSLTTVRQPIEEICMSAVELLLRKIEGEEVQDVINFLPVTVIRESCGCSNKSGSDKISDSYLRLWHGYRLHESIQTYSLDELFDSLTESLPQCYINSCFVSKYYGNSIIFDDSSHNSICYSSFEIPEKSELIYAFYNNRRIEINDSIKNFQTKDLVPDCFIPEDRRFIYLAVPLFFVNEHFGFVVFEVTNEDVITFEPLRGQISNTLKGALMLLEREKMEKSLLESERLASLGQLIGGISHNLMTPIMSIAGVCAGLEDLIKEYRESVGDPLVSFEDHHEIADEMMEWVNNLKEYNSYMCNVIKTVKNQAVRLNAEDDTEFTIGELVSQLKFTAKTNARYKNYSINFNILTDHEIELKGNIGNLVQIFENLILNSIQSYEGSKDESVVVDFSVEKRDGMIFFIVKDYGKGISSEIRNKIFKHMVTTKGKNGTGLSLLLSYSTIKGKFNGDMWFESCESKGTTFFVTIPEADKAE